MDAPALHTLDLIGCAEAGTLCGLFQRRCDKTPAGEAYRQYEAAAGGWRSYRWDEMHALVGRWQASLAREGFAAGDRVAVLLKNSVEWVCFDMAAQSLGLVVVPLYTTDNPENIAYILGDCGARMLFTGETGQWRVLAPLGKHFPQLSRVLCLTRSPNVPVAALHPAISHCFIALGLTLLQGYGLTEASPVVTANREDDNVPESVGTPVSGVELKIGEKDELLVKGPGVMLGYWNRPQDTCSAIDTQGWLHTGDQARIDGRGHVHIRGRLKEILVMSTGEKVAPADIEMAIAQDPLYEQVMVVGEGMPYLAALVVLNAAGWRDAAAALGLDADVPGSLRHPKARDRVVEMCHGLLRSFPGHAQVRAVWLTLEPWTIDNGLITPTMKLRRTALEIRYADAIRSLYAGHAIPA